MPISALPFPNPAYLMPISALPFPNPAYLLPISALSITSLGIPHSFGAKLGAAQTDKKNNT